MNTGEIIKELLNKQGKKQTDLAKYLGVSPNTVNRWIPNDKRPGIVPHPHTLLKIADFFHISTDILMGTTYELGSNQHLAFSISKMKKTEHFINWLESIGYTLEDDSFVPTNDDDSEFIGTIDVPTQISISWNDEIFHEKRTMKYVEFDLLMKKIEKHIRIELENYYEQW